MAAQARMMTSRTGAPRSDGFTYLELIIVLVILAMVTATAVPRLQGSAARLSLQQAQDTLISHLRYARSRAVAQRQPVQLLVAEGAAPSYQLQVPESGTQGVWAPIPGRFGRSRRLPDQATLEVRWPDGRPRTPAAVVFYPNGRADPAQLIVRGPRAATTTITIEPATGQIRASTAP